MEPSDATVTAVLDTSVADSAPIEVPPGQTPVEFAHDLGLVDWDIVQVPAEN